MGAASTREAPSAIWKRARFQMKSAPLSDEDRAADQAKPIIQGAHHAK
jgi:hypothetical protein